MEKLIFNIRPTLQALRKGHKANFCEPIENTPLFKIRKNTSSKVRLSLKWDDIINDTLLEKEIVDEVSFKKKKIYLFRKPYYVPDFNQYYARKVESSYNWYLDELIWGLLFLNPRPDKFMQMKITECILQKFTEHDIAESKIKAGEFVYSPILKFEDVLEMVKDYSVHKTYQKNYKPPLSKKVMYRDNYISKGEKIAFRSALRHYGNKKYYKKAIYKAINELIKNDLDVKICFKRLEDLKIIKKFKSSEYATAKLIREVITFRNKRIITKHNAKAPFTNVTKKEKYIKFCSMNKPTLNEIVKHCKISKRDAVEFRRLKQEGIT